MTAKEQRIRELGGGSPDQSRQPEDLFLKDRPNSYPIARLTTSSVPRNSAALSAIVRPYQSSGGAYRYDVAISQPAGSPLAPQARCALLEFPTGKTRKSFAIFRTGLF